MPMTHRDYYLKGRNDRILQVYREFAVNAAKSLGADDSWARENVDELIDFEIELANVSILTDCFKHRRAGCNNLELSPTEFYFCFACPTKLLQYGVINAVMENYQASSS